MAHPTVDLRNPTTQRGSIGERVIFTHTTPEDAGFGGHTGYGTRRAAFINLDGTGLTVVNTVYATHPRLQPVD